MKNVCNKFMRKIFWGVYSYYTSKNEFDSGNFFIYLTGLPKKNWFLI